MQIYNHLSFQNPFKIMSNSVFWASKTEQAQINKDEAVVMKKETSETLIFFFASIKRYLL